MPAGSLLRAALFVYMNETTLLSLADGPSATNHLNSRHWSVALGPSAKVSVVSFTYTSNAAHSKLPAGVRAALTTNCPSAEAIDAMDSEDLRSIAAYMVRPTTITSA